MKILHLTTHLNVGGITTYILRLIKPLKKLGVETLVLSSGGNCSQQFTELGAKVFELPIRTKNELNPKLYFHLPAVQRLIREHQIDLLHAHTRITQVMAFWLHQTTGIDYVTTCHGYYKRRLGRRILPAWGKCAIAISQGVADHLVRDFHLAAEQIQIIHNGVDLEDLDLAYARHNLRDVKASYGFKPDDPVIGVVARLVADKGHEYLIRSIPLLLSHFPSLRLLIVGDGPHRSFLEKLVTELGIQSHVVFTGNIQDVTHPLSAMDIFALPATWREGFGLSIVEAMACHKPVIVSNIWSLNTLIQDGVTGILIPPKAIDPLVGSIRRLLECPEERTRMSETGRAMVDKLFSISRMAEEIQQAYAQLLKHPA